jgi:hypothetical protein
MTPEKVAEGLAALRDLSEAQEVKVESVSGDALTAAQETAGTT